MKKFLQCGAKPSGDFFFYCHRVSFQEKIKVIHQFMFDNRLGRGLLKRVDHYFTLLWGQYKCVKTCRKLKYSMGLFMVTYN